MNIEKLTLANLRNARSSLTEDFNQAFYFSIEKDSNMHSFIFTLPDVQQDDFMKSLREIKLSMTWWQENSSYNYQIDGVKITGLSMDTQGAIDLIYGEEFLSQNIDKKALELDDNNMVFCTSQPIEAISFINFIENGINEYINPYLLKIGVAKTEQIYIDINDRFNELLTSLKDNISCIKFVSDNEIRDLNSTIYDYDTIKLNKSLEAALPNKEQHKAQKI
jgi:hypothetical protein